MFEKEETHPLVRIHIDHEPYHSPNPTTGEALYHLAGIGGHFELFKEVDGDKEDEPVLRDASKVHLQQDDHFYSQKVITVVVNTEDKAVVKHRLSYDEVVRIAFESPPEGPNIKITVDYSNGPLSNPQGALRKNQTVRIRNGMEFDVTATDRS